LLCATEVWQRKIDVASGISAVDIDAVDTDIAAVDVDLAQVNPN
jgi:hypothetical protein